MDSKSEVGLRIELESSVFALEGRYQSGPRHPWHRIFATLVFQQSKADHQGHSSARALTTYFDVFWVCSCYQFNLNGTIEQPTLGQLRRLHDCAVFWFPSIAGDGLWGQPKLSPHTKHNVSSSESTATACSGISCCPSKWIVYGKFWYHICVVVSEYKTHRPTCSNMTAQAATAANIELPAFHFPGK